MEMDCNLLKYQQNLARINASYKPYPPPPKVPLYARGFGGIILNVLLQLGVMAICITPGIILFCISNGNMAVIFSGLGAFIGGTLCMIAIILYISHLNKKLLENRNSYWNEKAKVLLWNAELDEKKKRLIEIINTLDNPPLNNVTPSAPTPEDISLYNNMTPSASAPEDISVEISVSDGVNECNHCFEGFKKTDVIFTYNCCKVFKGHFKCLIEWGEYSKRCPICRCDLSVNNTRALLSSIVKVDDDEIFDYD